MEYKGNTFVVKYVDPTIVTPGDGSTPATALGDLPTLAAMENLTCYLIRRTAQTDACTHPSNESRTSLNIMLLGMPLPTDPMYALVPAEAKTAWDADVETKAMIKVTNSSSRATMNTFDIFVCMNVYYFRAEGIVTSNNIWYFSDGRYLSLVEFKNVICTHEAGRIADLVSEVATNRYGSWFSDYYGGTFLVDHCEFDTADGYALETYRNTHVVVSNVEVFQLTGGAHALYLYQNEQTNYNRTMKLMNINFHIYVNGMISTSHEMPGQFYMMAFYMHMENIKVDMDAPVIGGIFTKTLRCRNYNWYQSCNETYAKNIDINYSKCHYIETDVSTAVVHFGSGDMETGRGDHVHTFEDISVKLATTGGLGSTNTREQAYPSTRETLVYVTGNRERAVFENLVIYHPNGRACNIGGANINNAVIDGSIYFAYVNANIIHAGCNYPGDMFAVSVTANRIFIEDIVCNKNNVDYPYIGQSFLNGEQQDGLYLVANNTNVPLFSSEIGITGNWHTGNNMISFNDVTPGNFRFRSRAHLIETWNVERDGNPVLKLTCLHSSTTWPLVIGREPSKGIEITPATTGVQELQIYMAYKNYVNYFELMKEFKVMGWIPQSEDVDINDFEYIDSEITGIWEPDTTSVYTNDSGLTAMVMKIPVNIATLTKKCNFRVQWNHYSSNGYLYLDPKFVLV